MGLKKDNIKTNEGKNYSEGSKRKFVQALSTYFDFVDVDWSPTTVFSDNEPTTASDPFARREREELLNTALEYKCPPNYKNVSPDERDRWNTYISQHFGKNKTKIGPSDWEKLRRSWKIPSLISATLDAGLRSEMIGRLLVEYVDLDNGQIHISPETAVKNNQKWTIELSNRSVKLLRKWFDQRGLKKKYDDSNLIWLNRKGNRYESSPLNNILQNLIAEAEIKQKGRKLTWHSIRHSTGMYVYDRERDLGLVAEVLRHASLESARKYAHPTPETKTGVIESIQGGGFE